MTELDCGSVYSRSAYWLHRGHLLWTLSRFGLWDVRHGCTHSFPVKWWQSFNHRSRWANASSPTFWSYAGLASCHAHSISHFSLVQYSTFLVQDSTFHNKIFLLSELWTVWVQLFLSFCSHRGRLPVSRQPSYTMVWLFQHLEQTRPWSCNLLFLNKLFHHQARSDQMSLGNLLGESDCAVYIHRSTLMGADEFKAPWKLCLIWINVRLFQWNSIMNIFIIHIIFIKDSNPPGITTSPRKTVVQKNEPIFCFTKSLQTVFLPWMLVNIQ